MKTADEVLAKHGIKLPSTAPGRHYTTCPQCSSTRSSSEHRAAKVLGITIEADGKVRFGCNHCGWTGPEKGNGGRSNGKGRNDLPTYVYRDAGGVVRFRKVRNLPGREPRFYFPHPDGKSGWAKGAGGADTGILYRIDEVAKAIESGAVVCIVEGEKDADRLWSLGIAASCNAHGASEPGKKVKWTKAHSEQLKGADIVVLNDNDAAGYTHADAAAKLSLGIAKRVRRLDLAPHWPDMPKSNDVSDWLDGGRSGQQLVELIESAPDYTTETDSKTASENDPKPASDSPGAIEDSAELERLARMSPLDYERARKEAGKKLGISRLSTLDLMVKGKRAELGLDTENDTKAGRPIAFPELEPWPEPVDGAALLDELVEAIGGHVVMLDHFSHTGALWVLHTHLIDKLSITPRLAIYSPTKRCGKTTLLDVLGRLVRRPKMAADISPSAIFRVVEAHRPTLLIDEADTFLPGNDDMRRLLNSGYQRNGTAIRNVGESSNYEPREFSTYAPARSGSI
jgi:hypothetical protein